MAIRVTGHQIKVKQEVRDYLEAKVPRLEKFTNRSPSVHVILEKDAHKIRAEIRVKAGPVESAAEARSNDAIQALDLALEKTEVQMRKKWEKLRGKKKDLTLPNRNAKKADLTNTESGLDARPLGRSRKPSTRAGTDAAQPAARRNGATAKASGNSGNHSEPFVLEKLNLRVFQCRRQTASRMDLKAAAEALYFNDDNFLCFINRSTGAMNVLYRRKDGDFALIEPKDQ